MVGAETVTPVARPESVRSPHPLMHDDLPSLDAIGRDLLAVPRWRRAVSLVFPFALVPLFFAFAARGWWFAALACPVILSFVTYGSVSHDLVHRTLHLPHWLNETLLS